MGQGTNYLIKCFQEAAGIEPPVRAEREKLKRLKQLSFRLIELLVLEESGIRDGDGCWHGCGPIHETVCEIQRVWEQRVRQPDSISWAEYVKQLGEEQAALMSAEFALRAARKKKQPEGEPLPLDNPKAK